MATGPDQEFTEPLRKIVVTHVTACDTRDGLRDYLVIFNEFIAASLYKQFHQIEGRSFIAICKSVIRNDPVNERGRLLMDKSVVAVIQASQCRLNRMLAEDTRGPAMLKGFLMAANRVGPSDAIMSPTDLPTPSWLSGVSPKSP